MKAGIREAIELLNKYITANPRKADGYNMARIMFEKVNSF
jgi:hypothetical protein